MKPPVSDIELRQHFREDKDFQDLVTKQFERMNPMLEMFETNKIYKMKVKEETGTIIFYVKSVTSILVLLGMGWAFLKFILGR